MVFRFAVSPTKIYRSFGSRLGGGCIGINLRRIFPARSVFKAFLRCSRGIRFFISPTLNGNLPTKFMSVRSIFGVQWMWYPFKNVDAKMQKLCLFGAFNGHLLATSQNIATEGRFFSYFAPLCYVPAPYRPYISIPNYIPSPFRFYFGSLPQCLTSYRAHSDFFWPSILNIDKNTFQHLIRKSHPVPGRWCVWAQNLKSQTQFRIKFTQLGHIFRGLDGLGCSG